MTSLEKNADFGLQRKHVKTLADMRYICNIIQRKIEANKVILGFNSILYGSLTNVRLQLYSIRLFD